MKKYLLFIFLTVYPVTCAEENPDMVAKKFTEALASGNIEEAKKYATEPTCTALDLASTFKKPNPNYKFILLKDSLVDDTAYVFYKNEYGNESVLTLYFVNGEWKVSLNANTSF